MSHSGKHADETIERIVAWYFARVYGRWEGPGTTPFYYDPDRIGGFAVEPEELAGGGDDAIFRLFITLSMYQALRDVVIMRQQRSLQPSTIRVLTDIEYLQNSIARHGCPALLSSGAFEAGCDVSKDGKRVDCGWSATVPCHVKDATVAFNRMGDMGKLPTSAWLRLWKDGGLRRVLAEVCAEDPSPSRRAALLVRRVTRVHRVGRKLATMFVSALSTPALAPGLTPWFPEVDGNDLVVPSASTVLPEGACERERYRTSR